MFGNRIRTLREENNMTQAELANYLGISPKAVSFYELNQREPSRDILLKLSRKFNVPIDYILDNKVAPLKKGRVPILGKVVAGVPLEAVEDILGYEEIPGELARTGEFFALKVRGDSMSPGICDGDIVIVKKQDTVEDKEVAIALVNGDEATIKEVQFHKNGLTLVGWNIVAFSPRFFTAKEIADLPVTILGKVVEMRRKF